MTIEEHLQESLNKALQPVITKLDSIAEQVRQLKQPDKEFLSRKEIMEAYGVSKYRIRDWEKNLLIRAISGNPKLYKREDVVKLMEEIL